MTLSGRNRSTQRKTCSITTLLSIYPKQICLETNLDFRGNRPTTKSLSHVKILHLKCYKLKLNVIVRYVLCD